MFYIKEFESWEIALDNFNNINNTLNKVSCLKLTISVPTHFQYKLYCDKHDQYFYLNFFKKGRAILSHWMHCAQQKSFEEVLECLDDNKKKTELLFHLDLFT